MYVIWQFNHIIVKKQTNKQTPQAIEIVIREYFDMSYKIILCYDRIVLNMT